MNIKLGQHAETRRTLHTHTHTHTSKALLSLLILPILVTPSFATVDISSDANSASCNNGTLSKYDGSVNLQAEWEPNTINVKWYNDTAANGATTPSTTNTCSYSGALTVPAAPAKKTGYTFAGWRLRAPEAFNLTTLLAQTDGCYSWAKGYYNSADRCTRPDCQDDINSENCSGANYADLNRYEWKVPLYGGGMLYGESSCNGIQGTSYFSGWMCYEYSNDARAADSMSVNDTGKYCWCRATGYKASGENKQSVTPSQWFYHRDFANANSCAKDCAAQCASYIVLDYSGWLERLLGQDYTCTE